MCDFTKGLKLCSCGSERIKFRKQEFYRKINDELVKIKDKKNESIPLIYIWRLFRYIDTHDDGTIGRYQLPKDDIGNGLNAEWICLNLNAGNCFDFDYKPNEGDNLFIEQNEPFSPYISFIFKNGEWVVDHYYPFTEHTEHIQDGLVKENEELTNEA